MQSLGNYKKLHISQRDRVTNSSTRNNSEPFIKEHFLTEWKNSLRNQSKLEFYRRVKLNFRLESYMNNTTYHARKNIACIRSSVHDLNLERGRYASKTVSPTRVDNSCRYFCSGEARERLKILKQLPFSSEPIIESEEHALVSCPAYHGIRMSLGDNLKSLLMLHEFSIIMETVHAEEFVNIFEGATEREIQWKISRKRRKTKRLT